MFLSPKGFVRAVRLCSVVFRVAGFNFRIAFLIDWERGECIESEHESVPMQGSVQACER